LTSDRIHVARFTELTPAVLYGIVKLRQDVFVVEQACAYDDMDGRDAEPDAQHLWIEADGMVAAALRLLGEHGGGHRIGRIVTAPAHRGRGLAGRLIEHAVALAGRPVVLSAQGHLQHWYERFGFSVSGESWVDAGIPHVPMRLA